MVRNFEAIERIRARQFGLMVQLGAFYDNSLADARTRLRHARLFVDFLQENLAHERLEAAMAIAEIDQNHQFGF